MSSIVPSPWPVAHIARRVSTDPDDEDDHGNYPSIISAPVIRKVMSLSQFGTSKQVMNTEAARRIETNIEMAVADPETYQPQDQVLLFPDVDGSGDYVPGSGVAFFVDGDPSDERIGPWPGLLSMFGGIVQLARIT